MAFVCPKVNNTQYFMRKCQVAKIQLQLEKACRVAEKPTIYIIILQDAMKEQKMSDIKVQFVDPF